MNDIAVAWGIGAVSGSRSLLGPALVGGRLLPSLGGRLLATLAAGEMAADKTAGIPARTAALPLAGRLLTGALAAAGHARPGRRLRAAAAGAAGALAGTYALYHLRRIATERFGVPNAVAGLAEDALAVGVGVLLVRRR